MPDRPQKITLRGLLVYCSDYRCSHSTAISGDPRAGGYRVTRRMLIVYTCVLRVKVSLLPRRHSQLLSTRASFGSFRVRHCPLSFGRYV
jgi:hypothetical protein